MKYVDRAKTLEILKMDSGLLPSEEGWNTFVPLEGDLAYVDETSSDYIFKDGEWLIITPIIERTRKENL